MHLGVLLVVVAGGCGRIAFDDRADATAEPIGHDEDGDGVPDTLDVCPHLPGSQEDADGDGVGDDCDFAPMSPDQTIALFVTFEGGTHPFVTSGSGVIAPQADALRFSGVDNQLALALPAFSEARVTASADILAVTGMSNEQVQLYISVGPDTQPHDYVELNQGNSTFQVAAITRFDGSTYVTLQTQQLSAQGIHTGPLVLQGTWLATGSLALDGGWPGEVYHVDIASSQFTGAARITLGDNRLDFDLRWLIVIATR